MIHFSVMKTASVADLRNHFRRISAWIEEGEAVEIVKRGKAFARLIPIAQPSKAAQADFRGQRKRVWGSRVFSLTEVKAMGEAEIEGLAKHFDPLFQPGV
jgi:antitoxin (DNA-binding transcriptional repressor) of toxin-antitoxin stability system